MRSPVREMWGKRILTEFLLVEEVLGLLSVTLDAVIWHTTLDAPLTWSCCRTKKKNSHVVSTLNKRLAQQVGTRHEQSSHVR